MHRTALSSIRHPAFPILILLVSLIPLAQPYWQPGYQVAHDRQVPFMRVLALQNALAEGQWPPRWFPDFDGGYGSPYPSFYGMMFYYAAAVPSFLQIPIGPAVEITAFLTFVVSAIGMYLFVRQLWGPPSGFLAAVLYSYAPYHLVDAFVRGAYSELTAFVWFPLILLTLHNWICSARKRWLLLGACTMAGLILTHNLMPILFLPMALLFPLLEIPSLGISAHEIKRRLAGLMGCWGLALLLSAYFWLPILLERNLIRMDYFLQFDYRTAFVALNKLIALPHGYRLTKEAGILHLVTSAVVLVFLLRSRLTGRFTATMAGALVAATVYLFMTTHASARVWSSFPLLSFVQFPWRFLAPAAFFLSVSAGALPYLVSNVRLKWAIVLVLGVAVMLLHQSLVQIPERVELPPIDRQFVCAEIWGTQDYRPSWSKTLFWTGPNPPGKADDPNVLLPCNDSLTPDNQATIHLLQVQRSGSTWNVDYDATETVQVTIPQFYYPGWKAWLDTAPIPVQPVGNHGLLQVSLPPGRHGLRVSFKETPVRLVGNMLTLAGLMISAGLALRWIRR